MAAGNGTYVYCLVAADRRPSVRKRFARLPGAGPVRLLDVDRGLWLVVATAPLDRYGSEAIDKKLSDLDWVSRAAVAHEAVVESFINARAVLPMKLFTIFTSDDRAVDQIRGDRARIDLVVNRVANHLEWGVRLTLDRAPSGEATPTPRRGGRTSGELTGASYLARKRAQRDAAVELAQRAHETVVQLYDRLQPRARLARRRSASELPVEGGPLLLDAAFLVQRSRATSFRALVAREARRLAPLGYHVTLSGPWPPYTFVKD